MAPTASDGMSAIVEDFNKRAALRRHPDKKACDSLPSAVMSTRSAPARKSAE
jgi:hypothetical protein